MDPAERVDIDDLYVELTVLAYTAVQRYEDFLRGKKGCSLQLARAMKDLKEFLPTDIGDLTDA
jgi:uncharacterized FAD-dependent dehydrogenase